MIRINQLDLQGIRKAKNIARFLVISICAACIYLSYILSDVETLAVARAPAIELNFVQFEEPRVENVLPEPILPQRLLAEESEFKVEVPPEPEKPIEKVIEKEPAPTPLPKEVLPEPPKPEKTVEKKIKKEPSKKKSEKNLPRKEAVAAASKKGENTEPSSSIVNPAASSSMPGSSANAQAKNKLAALLVALIEKKKRYPKAAMRSGTEGICQAKFKFDKEGKIIEATLVKESGKGILDRESASLAKGLIGTNFNIPNNGVEIHVPIKFELTNS